MAQAKAAQRHTASSSHPADQLVVPWSTVDPRHDKARVTAISENPLAPDRYDSVLAGAAFARWRRQWKTARKRLLWIKGDPGSGKTTQVCSIIDELQRNDAGVAIPYFFCDGSDVRRNTAHAILRGLIYLLVQQLPALTKYTAGQKCRRDRTQSTWAALVGIFSFILQDAVTKFRRVCFVVDGLDECEEGLPELLELVAQTSASSHVKWIVSSCDPAAVVVEGKAITLCLKSGPDALVTAHIVQRTAYLRRCDVETENAIRDALMDSSPLLRTALLCRGLADIPECDVVAYMRACPAHVDALYAHMMLKLDDACRRLLAVFAVARRPLALQELAIFLGSPSGMSADELTETLRRCSAFLTVHGDTVYFSHASAKTFLGTLKSSSDVFAACVDEANLEVFSKSLEAISRTLRRDIYNLRRPGITTDNIQTPDPNPLAAVRYSCVHWVDHLLDVHSSLDEAGNAAGAFLRGWYLYWLEALGLLGHVSEGVRAMERLADLVNPLEPTLAGLDMELVSDAHKFIATHASTIAHAPLQTYVSALLFTPAPNVIRELFAAEAPGWVTLSQPEVADDNHNGPVRAVTFSPTGGNSKFVASASDDNTLKIWDAQSRKCTQTLRGHTDTVWSPTFSHDSSMLCSASEDGTVRIWDIDAVVGTDAAKTILDGHGDASFSRRLTLDGHEGTVWSVAFAHAGELIATCSSDESVKIWDTVTGMCLQTLEGHTDSVYSVAFHRNNLLVSVSADATIRLWDVKAKTCTRIISLINDEALSSELDTEVIFSPDGHRVVTAGSQVRVWEVATGRLLLRIITIASVIAYSRDGKWLASGSPANDDISDDDGIVRLWDMGTGSCDREFSRPDVTSLVTAVALSHGSEMLFAAGYSDGGLTVWHAGSGVCLFRRSRNDYLRLYDLAFTRGYSQIVSGFDRGIVQVSSAATGICLQEFQGHDADINSVSISHDGRYLATASDDCTTRIWDIAYSRAIWAATFSHDNKMLATCCEGGTVRKWDLATGESKVVLEGGADPVYAVAFDHGCHHIATASGSGCVQIVPLSVDQTPRTLHGHDGAVWAVAYASDDRRLASAASDRTARVWDVLDGVCVQVLDIGVSLASIAFGVGDQYLRTEIGRIKLDTTATTDASKPEGADPLEWQHDYALSADKCWVSDRGENVLWLPWDYRPLSVAIDDDNNRICIGCQSGRIFFFSFSEDG